MATPSSIIPTSTAAATPLVDSTASAAPSALFSDVKIRILKNEASASSNGTDETPGSAGQKAMDAALEKMRTFEKAKASHSYGISSTIHYGLILPLKKMIVGLTDDQKTNLGLYQKHTALCSGIEKVQKAFKAYTAAKKTADDAPTVPVTAREGARRQAIAAGTALVRNYEELIGLAIGQAEGVEEHQTEYLKDLHAELDKDTKGLILKTVNTIRPNIDIETGLLDDKDSLRENLGKRYQKFVTEFVSKVHEAHCQTGDSSTLSAVTGAFIQGLAAIPELGELDDGLVLIELYDELSKKQADGVETTQDLAIQQFTDKIEALMNTDQPITAEDLQNIQYNGISLQSVKSIDVEELNKLKGLRKDLKDVQGTIQLDQKDIEYSKAILAKPEPYSFDDVKAFIDHTGDFLEKTRKADGNALDRLEKFYNEARLTRAGLTKRKEEIHARKAKVTAERVQVTIDNQAAVDAAQTAIAGLNQKIVKETLDLAAQEKELAAFQKEVEKEKKKLAGEKRSERLKNALTAGFKEESEKAMKAMKAEIDRLGGSLEASKIAREDQQEALEVLKADMKALNEKCDSLIATEDQALRKLNEDFLALLDRQIIWFSGKDIKVITENLDGAFSEEIEILKKLNQVRGAENRLKDLTSRGLELEEKFDVIMNELTTGPLFWLSFWLKKDEQGFVLNPDVFGDEEKAKITTQLESNLVIAKKVTLEVARKIVEQGNAERKQKADEDTGSHKSKLAYVGVVSRLELELEAREENKDSLDKLVLERVNNLPPVVPKKPVKAKQPEELRVLDESIDSDEDEFNETFDRLCNLPPDTGSTLVIPMNGGTTLATTTAVTTLASTSAPKVAPGAAEGVKLVIDEEM